MQTEFEVGHEIQYATVQGTVSQVRLFALKAKPDKQAWHPKDVEQSVQFAIHTEQD